MKIAIVGTGYVGLVAGVCFADVGHDVICVDNNERKILDLTEGKIPIYEPGLEDLMRGAKQKILFTTDISAATSQCDVIFIAVGTPEKPDGNADLAPTESVLKSICQHSKNKKYIVLKSTVPVGSHQWARDIVASCSDHDHQIINNPEFLKEGAAIDDFLKPDRVVIGCHSQEARQMMEKIYAPFVKNGHPILFMSNASAELTKYAANSFLSIKISFANELALLADQVGADYQDVRSGFSSDHRINASFFYQGVGYGGSCFPKDVQAIIQTAKKNETSMSIVEAADRVNDKQKLILFKKIQQHFGKDLSGLRFAMWGLAFKPRTDDVREAPAKYLIEAITKAGGQVIGYDPVANQSAQDHFNLDFKVSDSAMAATENADALLVVTEWNQFRNPDYKKLFTSLKQPIIFDGRNIFEIEDIQSHGFTYYCIGRQILLKEKNHV